MKRLVGLRGSRSITFWPVTFVLLLFTAVATGAMAQSDAPIEQQYDIALGELLDENGVLSLPDGFSGSIDPAGYMLVNDFEQAPRFVQSSESNERWSRDEFGTPGCSDHVYAFAAINGELYLGGSYFDACGFVTAASIARYNPVTGEFSSLGSGIEDGIVYTLAVIGTDLYVGGLFREAGGRLANYIAVYDTTQTGDSGWSALGSGVGDSLVNRVYSLAVIGTDLYVGGDFTVAGGKPASRIAVFDTTQEGNAGWSSLGSGVSGRDFRTEVRSLEVSGLNLYVGGEFTQAGQTAASRIAVYDTNQTGDTGWSSLGTGIAGEVEALELVGTDLYVGGRIAVAGGTLARNIAVYDTLQSGDAGWSALGSGLNSTVFALTAIGTDLFVGGSFTEVGGVSANSIAVFDTRVTGDDGWSTLGLGVDSGVRSLGAIGSDLYIGGFFGFAGGKAANRVAKYDTSLNSNQSWSALGSGLNDVVLALESIGSALYVAGRFRRAGNISASGIAVYKRNQAGQYAWSSLGDGVDGTVHALQSHGSNLYVGGEFTEAGGISANNIAVFDINKTENSGWTSLGSGTNGIFDGFNGVRAFAIQNNTLYVGGWFTSVGTISTIGIAAYDLTQSGDAGWFSLGDDLNGAAFDLLFVGNDLYVGGRFTQAGGMPANAIARFNTNASPDDAWSTLGSGLLYQADGQIFGIVSTFELIGDKLYVGGFFDTAGGQDANNLVTYDITQNGDSGWTTLGSGVGGAVNSLFAVGSNLYISGGFRSAGGVPAQKIAVYDTNHTGDAAWSAIGDGVTGVFVNDMETVGSDLFVSGAFWQAGGFVNGNLARLRGNFGSVSVPVANAWGLLLIMLFVLTMGLLQLRKPNSSEI